MLLFQHDHLDSDDTVRVEWRPLYCNDNTMRGIMEDRVRVQ